MAALVDSLKAELVGRSEVDALKTMGYKKAVHYSDFVDAKYFDSESGVFVTRDGRFAMVWRVPTIPDDALSIQAKRGICDAFATGLNRVKDNVSGQLIRFTHKDIRNRLGNFLNGAVESGFGRDVVNSVAQLQQRGCRQGFFATIPDSALSKAGRAESDAMDELYGAGDEGAQQGQERDETDYVSTVRGRRGGFAMINECYITITAEERMFGHEVLPAFVNRIIATISPGKGTREYRKEFDRAALEFLENVEEIEDTLMNYGLSVDRLDGQGLTDLLFKLLNPKRSKEGAPPSFDNVGGRRAREATQPEASKGLWGRESIAELASLSTIHTARNGWVIDNYHHRVASAVALPERMRPTIISDLLEDNEGEGWVSIGFHCVNQNTFRNFTLRGREMSMDNRDQQNDGPGILRGDRLKHKKAREDLDLVKAATNPSERNRSKVVNMTVQVVVRDRLQQRAEERIRKIYRGLWDTGQLETMRGDAHLHYSLPLNNRRGGAELLAREMRGFSIHATEMMPWFSGFQGYDDGKLLLNNDYGEPIPMDLYTRSVSAPHGLIVGGTGTGKSFLIANILAQLSGKHRPRIRIIDKGASYESLCESVGGDYVVLVSEETEGYKPIGINPLFIKDDDESVARPPTAPELERMVLVCSTMMLAGADEGAEPVTKTDRNTVMEALSEMFRQRKPGQELLLSDLLAHLRQNHGDTGRALATRMMDFSKEGLYGQMFDRPLEIDWSNDMIVFETGRMGESPALRVALLMLFEEIEWQMKNANDGRKGVILCDESWAVMSGEDAGSKGLAKRIGGFYREARKFGYSILLCSQALADFVAISNTEGSDAQDGIKANTSHFFLLGAARADMSLAEDFLGLTPEQLALWGRSRSLPPFFSEIFYVGKLKNSQLYPGKMRLYSNPIALWMATSAPGERKARQDLTNRLIKEKGLDKNEARRVAVKTLAKRYPYGTDYAELQHA